MEQSQPMPNQQTATPMQNTKKSNNIAKIVAGITSVIAVAGICFGIYGIVQGQSKNEQISDLEVQITNLKTQIEENELAKTDTVIENVAPTDDSSTSQTQNPIIIGSSPLIYNLHLMSSTVSYSTDGQYTLSVNVQDGEISYCGIYSVESWWADKDGDDLNGGMAQSKKYDKDCQISGLTGKIYKIVEIGEGQDSFENKLAFIMQDGSVEYLSLDDAFQKSDFNVRKLKIDGFVTDAFTVGVSSEGAVAGGYNSTIFVLSDGSYVKYDNSMLE